VKNLSGRDIPRLEVLVNQSDSAAQAHLVAQRIQQTARTFLHLEVTAGGYVPKDPNISKAVVRRRPFLIDSPHSPASSAIGQLAQRLKQVSEMHPPQGADRRVAYFPRLQTRPRTLQRVA
jgi:MinD-like ATPase involved in chromosome partitioning or flagellar assembly